MKDAHMNNLHRIYESISELAYACAELVDVATEIEDYEAVRAIDKEIVAVRKKASQYVSIWNKNMKGAR